MVFSGKYGIVLLPDTRTSKEAERLAGTIKDNMVVFSEGRVPHATLYHTSVCDFPEDVARTMVTDIAQYLPLPITFTHIGVAGGKYLFWHLTLTEALQKLHSTSLTLSRYFDSTMEKQSSLEGLLLSDEEHKNVIEFGHPYVGSLWQPHITVGYRKDIRGTESYEHVWQGELSRVAFVEIVGYGQARIVFENT